MEQIFDPAWYRVADLKPRLRPHVKVLRHHYRGERWYVVQDASTGRFHRFNPLAYRLIGLMDGRRTLDSIWDTAARELGDDVPTQGETLRLMHQLHAADVLQTDIPADPDERLRRHDEDRRKRLMQHFKSPLAIRLPLFDPERFLNASIGLVRPWLSWGGFLVWAMVVGLASTLAVMHWDQLSADTSGNLLAPQNLLLLLLAFPFVKALHELGHAYAVKHWGGEVHQIGIMFLVFMPIPFVDASASAGFRSKRQRALVGAMGMLVEVFLASLAMFVWLNVEPGLVKALAYNVMIIAGISTLLFNGNPLLRFDAYYILSDLVEIPGLATRANKYYYYLAKRYAFRLRDAESPVNAPGERGWFLFYAPASLVYRVFIFFAIIVFVAGQFFFVGVLLSIWATIGLFVLPLYKGAKYLITNPELGHRRGRALWMSGGALLLLTAVLFALPVPLSTVAEGVVWAPEGSHLRAGASGFVAEVHHQPGDRLQQGDSVLRLEDPLLRPELEILRGELAALEAQYDLVRVEDRNRAEIALEQIRGVRARIARKREQIGELRLRAPREGTLVLIGAKDLPGRFVPQGELLGYVMQPGDRRIRTVVTQDEVDLVRNRTHGVQVRTANGFDRVLSAQVAREVPSATLELPSMALGTAGGGRIAIDPRDQQGSQSLEKVFQFELNVPVGDFSEHIGTRVHVRFDHGWEPIGWTAYRALRRLFLRHFDV